MNLKQILYKFGKAAAIGAVGAFTIATQTGLPASKQGWITLGGAVGFGAVHALTNALEQWAGYTTTKTPDA